MKLMSTMPALVAAVLAAAPVSAGAVEPAPQPATHVEGVFDSYQPGATAITYRPELVPVGSSAKVLVTPTGLTGTGTTLVVNGLVPERAYGAHAHTKPCGEQGDAAGPHFQHNPDPVTPSVDPAYANPHNEIWLDFTTNRAGTAIANSQVSWQFLPERRAQSIVIHETHTHVHPGHAGTAGARLACINVDF